MRLGFVYTVLIVFLFSCKKDDFDKSKLSNEKSYISMNLGMYSEYAVEEIIYDDFKNTIDTFRYQLKELNESKFTDNLGKNSIRVDRYTRTNDTTDWVYLNTWYSTSDIHSIQRVENNIRRTVLSFPITFDAIWNSNEFNMEYINNVFYTAYHRPYSINNLKFDSTVTVESVSVSNTIKERTYKEVYAKNVGLVYKNIVFIDKIGILQRGRRVVYKMTKHVP